MGEQKAFEVGGGEAMAYGALTLGEKDGGGQHDALGVLPASLAAKHELHLQANLAEELHHYFSECIRVADQKAAFLFVACGALLAYLFDKIFDRDNSMKKSVQALDLDDFVLIAIVSTALIAVSFLIRSAFFAIRLQPHIWKSEQLRDMFRRAIAKDLRRTMKWTGIAVAVIGVVFFADKNIRHHLQQLVALDTFFFALFAVAIIFLVGSAWTATRVVTPRLWPSHGPHMFWEDVYKKFPLPEDAEKYANEVMGMMTTKDFIQEKLKNCHDLAHLCHAKYHDMKRAITFGRIGCIFTFLFLVFYYVWYGSE